MLEFGFKKRQAKSRSRIGIDIGSHSIKIVQLSGTDEKPSLVCFGLEKVKGPSQSATISSIKKLTESLNISGAQACIGVAGPSVIVRLISLPKMSEDELAGAVKFEAEKFIPFEINECVLDFQVIKSPVRDKTGSLEVLLAAAKKDFIMQRIKALEGIDLSVVTVDVDILAVTNAFLRNFPEQDQSKTLAIVDIGASCTDLSILKGKIPSFVRQISIGSNDCRDAIASKMELDKASAEAIKDSPKDKLPDVISCNKPVLSNLLDEIKLSFGYYENQSGRSIDEIYLAGGGAAIIGLEDAFKESLGSSPKYWDPFKFLNAEGAQTKSLDDKTRNAYGVAVGLALRA